jgi:hypothetical protein
MVVQISVSSHLGPTHLTDIWWRLQRQACTGIQASEKA